MYVRARSGAAGSAVIGYDEQYFGRLWIVACCTPRRLIRGFLSNDMKPMADLGASSDDSENICLPRNEASWATGESIMNLGLKSILK